MTPAQERGVRRALAFAEALDHPALVRCVGAFELDDAVCIGAHEGEVVVVVVGEGEGGYCGCWSKRSAPVPGKQMHTPRSHQQFPNTNTIQTAIQPQPPSHTIHTPIIYTPIKSRSTPTRATCSARRSRTPSATTSAPSRRASRRRCCRHSRTCTPTASCTGARAREYARAERRVGWEGGCVQLVCNLHHPIMALFSAPNGVRGQSEPIKNPSQSLSCTTKPHHNHDSLKTK